MKAVVRIIILALIVVLAVASVINIHTRAEQLHADAGWQSWLISLGVAVSFALFAFCLVVSKNVDARIFFFFCAAFGATLTGIFQTGMYRTLGADWVTSVSLGGGVPALEALLAVAEHFLNTDQATKKPGANALWMRLGNAVASRIERPTSVQLDTVLERSVASSKTPDRTLEKANEQRKNAKLNAQNEMLEVFRRDPNASLRTVGKQIGRSPSTVSSWLDELESANTIHRNGNGVRVL